MYAYLSGTLAGVEEDAVVVDNHGIGYRCFVSASARYHLPPVGEQVKVYTYLNVREDAMQLFGFLSEEELAIFKLLIAVNGIGPKGALAILGVLSAEDLRFAVMSDNAKAIAAAPGIGGKTAQRVIIDLKDKLDQIPSVRMGGGERDAGASRILTEVAEALQSLGYAPSEAYRAMEGMEIGDGDTVETVLKEALKKMAFL